jgi:Ca-activated chloride channel homolog
MTLFLSLFACTDSNLMGSTESASDFGVTGGGAQDFGKFKEILEEGGIPGPETIDDVGFFAEHSIELPEALCEGSVCLHSQVGHMGNMISGSDCTVLQLGMNAPAELVDWERPPLNLVIAVDVSGSMKGDNMSALKSGLHLMLPALQPTDTISFVAFNKSAVVVVDAAAGDESSLGAAIDGLTPSGGTDIYEGLRTAYDQGVAFDTDENTTRVMLVSDGIATEGLTDTARILNLADAYNDEGIGLTTIGLGENFDIELMRGLAEEGGGAFYFLQDVDAVTEVFSEEVSSFLVPLAEDVTIDVAVYDDYLLRSVYGSHDFQLTDQRARLDLDILQTAHREGADDNESGRRGGGGALILEMLPLGDPSAGAVGRLDFSYTDTRTGERVVKEELIMSGVAPGTVGEGGWFEGATVEKGFVMLNLYVGFEIAAERSDHGDYSAAWSTLNALEENVSTYVLANPDADLEDDLVYVRMFMDNIESQQVLIEVQEVEPWPAD